MVLQAVLSSNELTITEDWGVIKIVGSKDKLDGVNVGDIIEYVPSWSEYKLTDLDKQMYEKGFRYKKYIVMRNDQSLDLVNELVPVYIDTQTPISEGKMRDDAGDLRFYWWDETNKVWTEVDYWIDNDTVNTTSTKVILRIPKVSANGYVNVVMYYGAKHFGRKDDYTIAFGNRAKSGKVMSLDGIDDYVIVDDANDMLAPDTFTVIVWVKDYSYDPNNLGLIAKGNPNGTDPSYSWFFGYYTTASEALGLVVRSNGSTYIAGFKVSSFDGMLAGVADGSQLKVYANGTLVATGSYPGTIDKYNFPLLIGMVYNQYWINVDVHRVMIYNRALSDTEIQQIYDNPNDPPRAGLILWYAPDSVDDVNGVWQDKSGLGNGGTIVGATPVDVRNFESSIETSKVLVPDGVDDYVQLPSFIKDWNELTIALQVEVDAYDDTGWFVNNTSDVNLMIFIWPDETYGLDAIISDGVSSIRLQSGDKTLGKLWFVVRFSNGVLDGFRDGMLIKSVSGSIAKVNDVTDKMYIFRRATGLYSNDKIYRLYVWNRALSDTEIQNLHNDPNNPPLDGLKLWLDGTSIDEINGKWLNKAPILKSGYVEPLDGTINGATPIWLLRGNQSGEVDMNNGVKIIWRGTVAKKVESGNSIVLYVKTDNLSSLMG